MDDDGHRLTVIRHEGDRPLRVRVGKRDLPPSEPTNASASSNQYPTSREGSPRAFDSAARRVPDRSVPSSTTRSVTSTRSDVGGDQADQQASRDRQSIAW